ncbi:hypothetical protein D3C73_677980 [compost metagenome]
MLGFVKNKLNRFSEAFENKGNSLLYDFDHRFELVFHPAEEAALFLFLRFFFLVFSVCFLLGFAVGPGGFPFRFGMLCLRLALFFRPDVVDLAFFLLCCGSSLTGIVGFGRIQLVFPFAAQMIHFRLRPGLLAKLLVLGLGLRLLDLGVAVCFGALHLAVERCFLLAVFSLLGPQLLLHFRSKAVIQPGSHVRRHSQHRQLFGSGGMASLQLCGSQGGAVRLGIDVIFTKRMANLAHLRPLGCSYLLGGLLAEAFELGRVCLAGQADFRRHCRSGTNFAQHGFRISV